MEAAVNKSEVQAYKERLTKRQKCADKDGDSTAAANAISGGKVKCDEEEEEIKPVVPLSACLARLTADETLPDYRSPATGKPGPALKHVRMGNFPKYLFVQLNRCVILKKVTLIRAVAVDPAPCFALLVGRPRWLLRLTSQLDGRLLPLLVVLVVVLVFFGFVSVVTTFAT